MPSYVKALLRKLLAGCEPLPASDRTGSTDAELAYLALTAVVITDDARLYRRWAAERPRLVAWTAVEAHLKAGGRLAELLRRCTDAAGGHPTSG